MDKQYINILHAPKLDIGVTRQSFKQQIEIIYKLENSREEINLIGRCEWQGSL